jgi:hypothetical protein
MKPWREKSPLQTCFRAYAHGLKIWIRANFLKSAIALMIGVLPMVIAGAMALG